MAEDKQLDDAFKRIGQIVDGVVSQACLRHYRADTQEHQFSAKVAEALERELGSIGVNGVRLSVHVQDFPDKGRGSKEKKVGADLYISTVLRSADHVVSKGMLVQSKWDDTYSPHGGDILEASKKMATRSKSSYIWVYGPAGISVLPVREVRDSEVDFGVPQTVGQTIANGFRCTEGDRRIGRDPELPLVESLNNALTEITANRAVSFLVDDLT